MKIEVYSPTIRRKEMDAVLTAMVEDKIGPGGEAKLLIQTAKERIKFDYCLALRSPAIALHLALKSLDLKAGQGVVISALSPLYYTWVINDLGLSVIYCDVLPSSTCVGRETVEKAITSGPEPRCIIVHHTLGYVSDTEQIAELGLPIIEDCSQSYGTVMGYANDDDSSAAANAAAGGVNAENAVHGNVGMFTILGLEERDMLTSGGGALLYSASRRDGSMLRSLGDLPSEYGLPDMNAALAVVQFRESAKNISKRAEIARLYTQSVLRTRHRQLADNNLQYNNYAFSVILETGMKDARAYAKRKDIAVESAFENTPAGHAPEENGTDIPVKCPEAFSLSLRTLLFPIYPRLTMADAGKVSKLIQALP